MRRGALGSKLARIGERSNAYHLVDSETMGYSGKRREMIKGQSTSHSRRNFHAAQGARPLGLAFFLFLPLLVGYNDYILQVLTHALLLATLALAWNILGLSGAISLGHAAFFGVGAYTSGLLSLDLGISPWATIPLAGLSATADMSIREIAKSNASHPQDVFEVLKQFKVPGSK